LPARDATVKARRLVPSQVSLATEIGPVTAPGGTLTRSLVGEAWRTPAGGTATPPNFTVFPAGALSK